MHTWIHDKRELHSGRNSAKFSNGILDFEKIEKSLVKSF